MIAEALPTRVKEIPANSVTAPCDTAAVKVLASRRLPGDAFDELDDVEVIALTGLSRARPDIEAVIVANEAVPLDLLPGLRLVAKLRCRR